MLLHFYHRLLKSAKEEYFHSFLSQKINYYYIFAIVFLTVLLVDAKPRTFRLVKDLFSRMNESGYEVMQLNRVLCNILLYFIFKISFYLYLE